MLPKDTNVNRDTNAIVMLADSYLYDKLDKALKAGIFMLSENNSPVVPDLKKVNQGIRLIEKHFLRWENW